MTQIASLTASMSLESAEFLSGLKRVGNATERTANAIDKSMSHVATAVKGLAAVFAADKAIEGARKYLQYADAMKKMEAQTKLATAQFGNQGRAQQDIIRISKDARMDLEATTSLYGKMLPAARDLGKGQQDASRATETFSKALKIGGAGANEAASATLQFGQALASGVLRGDEFNSINEASPRIMRLLADSMGQPVGSLRKMAEEGKLTSDVLFKALTDRKFTDGIDKEFAELPVTFGEAQQQMENSLTQLIGAFDKGSGISTALSEAMLEGASTMDDLVGTAQNSGEEIRATFAGLHDAFAPMLAGGMNMFDMLGVRVASFSDQVRSILSGIDQVRNILPDLQRNAQKWDEKYLGFRTGYTGDVGPRSNLVGDFDRSYQGTRRNTARSNAIENIRKYGPDRSFDGKGMTDMQIAAKGEEIAKGIAAGKYVVTGSNKPVSRPTSDKKGSTKGGGGGKGKDPAKEAEREAAKERRDLEAFQRDIERLQNRELDSRAALANTATERFAFERQQLELDRTSEAAGYDRDGPAGSKRYTAAQVERLKTINDQVAWQKAQLITQREQAFQAEEELTLRNGSLANATSIVALQSSLARTAKDRRAAEMRLLDLQFQQEKVQLDAIIASRDATVAEKEIARARLALLPMLKAGQYEQVRRDTMGPLASYLDAIPKTGGEIRESIETVAVDGMQSLRSELLSTIMETGNLADAFKSLSKTVVSGLLDIAIQQTLIKPLGSLLFGGSSGGGLFGSLLKGVVGIASGGLGGGLSGGIFDATTSIGSSALNTSLINLPGLTGARANGGLTRAGSYLVGERGAEIVDIGNTANVIPAHKTKGLVGGGNPAVNVTFGSIVSNDPAAVKAMAMEAIAQMQPMIIANATNATMTKLRRPGM